MESPIFLIDAVVDGDHRSVKARVDVDASARGVRRDHVGGVARGPALGGGAGERRRVVDVVRVPGVGGDREVGALGEPGERADQGVGQLAVLVGVEQDLVDVPVGVVVGEDRGAQVLVAAGGPQVAGGGADRVDRVVGVLAAVVVGVDPVGRQVEGMNCIQPSAPAEETFRLVPKAVSILLIEASTCQGIPYSVPQDW